MTEQLYLNNSYAASFTAKILDSISADGNPALILDKTLFYPTSGGQLHDTGFINDVPVINVYEDGGVIIHVLEREVTADTAECRIDWERRFDHMQQHTGQHILSQSIIRTEGAETISSSLGRECSTIDIDIEAFSVEHAVRAEDEANRWVYLNLPVQALYPTDEELEQMPLRKKPPAGKKVRIIHIEGLDYSPCGGTHCSMTGEVGIIKIRGWEKVRGKIRLEFYCGKRALKDYQSKNHIVNSVAGSLSIQESNIEESVQKLLHGNKSLQKNVHDLRYKLFEYQAQELYDAGEQSGDIRIITYIMEDGSISDLQALAQQIRKCGTCVLVLGGSGEKSSFVFTCTDDVSINLLEALNALRSDFDVKGGGGATMVQGGLPAYKDISVFINAARQAVIDMLHSQTG